MGALPAGTQPFAHLKAPQVLLALREMLAELKIPNAGSYRTHDFRRGHADDMRRSGSKLWEILSAGDWRSAAFLGYLNKMKLGRDLVLEAQTGFSDSEDGADDGDS